MESTKQKQIAIREEYLVKEIRKNPTNLSECFRQVKMLLYLDHSIKVKVNVLRYQYYTKIRKKYNLFNFGGKINTKNISCTKEFIEVENIAKVANNTLSSRDKIKLINLISKTI